MLSFLKATIGRLVEKLGYTIIPNWRFDTYPTARYMRSLFEFLNVDLVLDVGANVGQYYDFLRQQVGYQGHVISFEPVPQLSADLRARASKSSYWQIDGRALGSSIGTADFNVMMNTQMSSFLTPDHSNVGFLLLDHNTIEDTIQVEITTVDEMLPGLITKYACKNIYLKLDTQGFDLEVLKGAMACLPRIAALQSEASVTPVYADMPGYHEVIRFLEEHGFVLSGVYPNNFEFTPRLLEFDCYMINKARLP